MVRNVDAVLGFIVRQGGRPIANGVVTQVPISRTIYHHHLIVIPVGAEDAIVLRSAADFVEGTVVPDFSDDAARRPVNHQYSRVTSAVHTIVLGVEAQRDRLLFNSKD
jgi:hypothetical protein